MKKTDLKPLVRCASVVFLLHLTYAGYAQVVITPQYNSGNNFSLNQLWDFSLNCNAVASGTVLLTIIVSNESGEAIVRAETPRFELAPALNSLSQDIIKNASYDYTRTDAVAQQIKKEGFFPKGLYYICINISTAAGIEIGSNCTQVNVTANVLPENPTLQKNNNGRKQLPVQFHGYSELTGVYSNVQTPGSANPPAYAQWYFNPTLSLYDFPVSGQLLLSTRQQEGQQNINTFNISFDANQFKNFLRQRVMQFLTEKAKADELNLAAGGSFISQYNNVQKMLSSPGTLDELSRLKELDSLKALYAIAENQLNDSVSLQHYYGYYSSQPDSSLQKYEMINQETVDSLRSKIKALEWLELKRPYYEKLQQKKDEIRSQISRLGLDSLLSGATGQVQNTDYKRLADPGFLLDKLKENHLFRKGERFMYAVRSMYMGTSYPSYSDLTLQGMPVNGVSLEIEPWGTYAAFVYGTIQDAVYTQEQNYAAYKRTVTGGSFGYGRKEKSYIHFTILQFADDPESISPRDSIFLYINTPKLNQVVGMDFKISLLKNRFKIYGELSGSQLVRDVTLSDSLSYNIGMPPPGHASDWMGNIFTQRSVNNNTVVDYAFRAGAEATFWKGRSKISAGIKRTGPYYTTLGNPFLMKDIFGVEFRYSQALWKNRLTVAGYLRRNSDNLSNTKLFTSQLYNWGFDISLNIPKWPSLKVNLTPYIHSSDSTFININVLTVNSNYSLRIKKIQMMNTLAYIRQDAQGTDSLMSYSTDYVVLNQMLVLSRAVSVNIGQNYIRTRNRQQGELHTYALNLGGSYLAFRRWNNVLGGSAYINRNEARFGAYYQSGITFAQMFTFNFRAEYNTYSNYANISPAAPYDQVSLRGTLVARW